VLWLDRIHRWTGGFIGLLLAALALTGTLLLYKDAWLRATVPHADEALVEDVTAVDAVIERLLAADTSSPPTGILFPTDSLGLFRLSFEGGAGAYANQSGAIVVRWTSKWERLELWVFDFHHHLLMGDTGTTIAGILALIGMGFVITGLLLWWRRRKAFAFRLLPSRLSRFHITSHHRDLGAVMAPLLSVTLLTGAMLTLRPVADFLLSPLSPGTIAESLAPPQVKGGPMSPQYDWRTTLQTVRSTYPEAELRSIGIPRREGELLRIRVRQPAEWLPNGRTVLWFDPADGRLVEARDARTLPLATRAFNLVYPIHASAVGGVLYKAVMTVAGLSLLLLGTLAMFGFWSFQARRASQASQLATQP
jgi:LPXTG-motif cell wall-anchored protein